MDGFQVSVSSTDSAEKAHLVLLVEDNHNDELLALRALRKANASIKVDVVRDGIEAIDYLCDPHRPCPDLVMLDLKLPKVSGLEVLKRVRATEKMCRTPIVMFTSSNEQTDVAGCFDSGANGFVRKSVDYQEYMNKVWKVADYWLNINEPCLQGAANLCSSFVEVR
jgi:two-component system response regulator